MNTVRFGAQKKKTPKISLSNGNSFAFTRPKKKKILTKTNLEVTQGKNLPRKRTTFSIITVVVNRRHKTLLLKKKKVHD